MSERAAHVADISVLSHSEALDLAGTEYARFIDLLTGLEPDSWRNPTECPSWDVRTMASHVLAAAEAHASAVEFARQMWLARPLAPPLEDALSEVQTRRRQALSPDQIVDGLRRTSPRSVSRRRRIPAALRAIKITYDAVTPPEKWKLGYLLDVIYTRDCWMHRIDISRATGRDVRLDSDHDGRIVAEVVVEWARRSQQAVELNLTGPAGGRYLTAAREAITSPAITIDAVEFCRIAAGRQPVASTGDLPLVRVPF
ncbi:MAG TPA: maleylpyruvate isomerase family mycothiol-dependent enzyme [Mycobacteriales bacterium]|nr:maleylpyruvate isomerase family mycothiol-dependent enzyme [Mycobacteriales bacterium]